jgi:tRNA A-37 threonylcarbamoyl transferase component Bud32
MSAANEPDVVPSQSLGTLPTHLDRYLAPFEAAWKRAERPVLEAFLPPAGADRQVVLAELICIDLQYRLQAGESARAEDYLTRYPELGIDPERVSNLIVSEYRLRRGREPELTPAEYERRFPHLASQLERLLTPAPTAASVPATDWGIGPQADSVIVSALRGGAALQLADYDVLGEVGRGGMGVVYRVRERQRGRIMALKTLQGMNPAALLRFKQEFRALAGVTHPNLVSLYELMCDRGQWLFTMEFVAGVDFLDYVRAGVAPSGQLVRARAALRQLAQGVAALHAAGRLHRDIKPRNVLVTPEGRVVLLDFGLAAELDQAGLHQSTEQHLLGTIAYMSPEQAAAQPVSPATDWYSVGVMLYEVLTGRLPLQGGALQLLQDKQTVDPPAPHELVPDVPEDLDRLCMELLRRHPAARPTGAEILRRLDWATPGDNAGWPRVVEPVPPPRSRPLFVGREGHLATLAEAFAAVRRGETVGVSVYGPSGAGKSALLQHFLDGLGEHAEAVVLAGRCYEQESVPYKALDSLIDALSRYLGHLPMADAQALLPRDVLHLARVFPVLQRVQAVAKAPSRPVESADPHEARRRAAVALRELLARLGDRQPLVLFIDDLQWGDLDSAALLADLLRPPDPPVLLLLGAYRSEDVPVSPFLRAYLEPQTGAAALVVRHDLVVDALTPGEAQDLAMTLIGRSDPDTRTQAEAIARESGGNPFFVYELVQHVRGQAGREGVVLSQVALDEVLWSRIVQLPEEARHLLEVVAAAGRPVRDADACRAAGVVEERAALATLQSGRLIRTRRREIDTYHDRVRETMLAHLDPAALSDCHRCLAETLESGGATDPEVLAVHFQGAGQAERAGRYFAAAAAQAAQALAFEHAARLYRQALQLSSTDAQEERELRVRLADALANAGRGADAAREYLAAAASASIKEGLEFRRRAGLQYLVSGHVDDGIRALRPVLSAVGMRLATTPLRALLALLFRRTQLWLRGVGFRQRLPGQIPAADLERIDICWSVAVGLVIIDPIRSAPFSSRGLLLALKAGEPFRIARALAIEAALVASAGGWAQRRGVRLLKVAEDLARRLDEPYARGMVTMMTGCFEFLEGRWKTGLEHCDRAEKIFRDHCIGANWELDTAHTFSLWSLNFMGQVVELRGRWHQLVLEARTRGDLYALANLPYNMALVRLAAEDVGEARRELHEALSQWTQEGYHIQHHNALLAQVQIELYSGNATAAWEQVTKNWPAFSRALLARVQCVRIQMRQMRAYSALAAAVTASNPKPLLHAAKRDARRFRSEQLPWADGLDRYIRAALAVQSGDDGAARRLLDQAITAFESINMGLYAAATRRRLGQMIGGAEGQALMAEADAWMARQTIRNPARMAAVFAPGFPD